MRSLRYRGPVLVLMLALLLASVAVADVFLLDFYGYDYWWPFTMPPETMGNCYNALGFVPAANATYLTLDLGANEYTFSLQNVCWQSADTIGDYVIWTFTGGTFDVYEDDLVTGTAADYGVNPPNATAPLTFEDGTNILGGDFVGLQIVVNTLTGFADLQGELNLVRGSQLGNIPPAQRTGWTLAGLRADTPQLPDGYFWQIDGQLFIEDPVPVEKSSWGSIKKNLGGE